VKFVKISDLSEEEKEKWQQQVQARQQERINNNQQELLNAQEKIQKILEKNGEIDNSNHTYKIKDVKQNASKNYYNQLRKDNKLTVGDAISESWTNIGSGIKGTLTNLAHVPTNQALTTKKNKENIFSENLPTKQDVDNSIIKNKNTTEDIGGLAKLVGLGASTGVKHIGNYLENANENILPGYKDRRKQQFFTSPKVNDINKSNAKYQDNVLANKINNNQPQNRIETNLVKKTINDSINNDEEKMQNEQNKLSNPITQKLGEIAPSLGQMLPGTVLSSINPALGTSYFLTSSGGSYINDAKSRGMTDEQAFKYGTVMGTLEGASESIITGQQLNKITKAVSGKEISKSVLESYGFNIFENAVQEAVMEPAQELTASIVGNKADWTDIGSRMWQSGLNGALMGVITNGATAGLSKSVEAYNKVRNNQKLTESECKQAIQEIIDNFGTDFVEQNIKEGATEVYKSIIDSSTSNNEQNDTNNPNNIYTKENIQEQNKIAQNQDIEQLQQNNNENKVPIRNYQYQETDNSKINNLRQDMSKYWTDTNETKSLSNVIEKIITDKGYNVRLDDTIKNAKGNPVNAQITTLNNGEVEIKINPNASSIGEFLLMHETTHAIGTQEIKDLVIDYARKNKEFNNALESLKETYGVQDVNDEVLADISGQLFGNQEFINNLSTEKPNIFKRIYNKIIELANKITGNSKESLFVRNLANKWQEAYIIQNNNLNNNSYYSIQTDSNGNRYVKVDTDQNIFEGINKKDYNKIAKMYIQDYLMGKTILNNTDSAVIDSRSAKKYTNPTQNPSYIIEKMKLTPELKNVLEISQKESVSLPTKENSKYKSWEYYKFNFELSGKKFEGTVNIGIDKNGNKHFYEINKIHSIPNSSVSTNKVDTMNNINNSILPTKENVNRNTTKYSMQKSENNSTNKWQQYINNNFKVTGTRTNLEDIKLPTKEYYKNKKIQELLTNKDLEVVDEIYEKEGRTEVLTEKKKAKILDKFINDKMTFRDSLDAIAQKFVNKGHYVDKLSDETKNPELKYMYDRNLNSFAEGQYVIGVAQTDNKGNKIGKSINDIWKPIENNKLVKEFSEYLLHKHNIDRSGRKKFVFGEGIGPTESTAIALELENKHPEFKQYAEDIKKFNHNNLINLKEAGLLTQDTIDYIESIYPNYIAISRNIEDILYAGSNEKTGTALPLKKAIGGSADILPLKDAMAQQAIRIKRLINQNELGKELAKSLKNAQVDQGADIELSPTMLLDMNTMVNTDVEGNKYYLYFENGKQLKLRINDNLYESLKPTEISKLEKTLPVKALQKVNNIHRSLLTSSNPLFIVTNFFKDFQDGMFNSKYSSKFIKNYGKALNEIYTKGKYYESYMANGGLSNSYFDYETGMKKENKFTEKIRSANEIVEQLPRLAEFISTLEDGKSLNEALYNAAEITTNFKRGGEKTKAINRNGVNFLNASIQGLDKQFRNFSGQNGVKGYVNLLAKATIMGVIPAIFNHILLDDDEDYQDLPQSDKDLYYLFKYNNGKFIRIPKGRVLSIFGAAARRTLESVQGQDDAWKGFGSTVSNQIAPNNPLENNILAPLIQAGNNKTWYGSDLVSSRLQKELPQNQYDESTDELSKKISGAVGKLPTPVKDVISNIPILNKGLDIVSSPKKLNYVIDQYSGGIGDILLPMITPQAKENVLIDKFTTDSILKNKNVSKFYETLEKQTQIANDNFATDEDELQLKYLNSINKEMGDLYKAKRQIQMSNISNKEKKEKVRELQEKINQLAGKGLSNYNSGSKNTNYSKIGDNEYYKNNNGEWTNLTDEEKEKNKNISLETYSDYKQKAYNKKQEKISNGEIKKSQDLKQKDKIQILLDSKYSEKEKKSIYENYILSSSDNEYSVISKTGIDFEQYLKYKQQDFKSDKEDDGTLKGKSVTKSKQNKVEKYLNDMKITDEQRLLLYAINGYSTTSSQKKQLANYVYNLDLNKQEKLDLYNKFSGFKVYKDGRVQW